MGQFMGSSSADIAGSASAGATEGQSPAGWVLVPREPTEKMLAPYNGLNRVRDTVDLMARTYRGMLSRAPTPPSPPAGAAADPAADGDVASEIARLREELEAARERVIVLASTVREKTIIADRESARVGVLTKWLASAEQQAAKDYRTAEASKWAEDYLPPATCGDIDSIQNALELLRDANSQLRHAAHFWRRIATSAGNPATDHVDLSPTTAGSAEGVKLDREQVARIIDPEAFAEQVRGWTWDNEDWADWQRKLEARRSAALAKADAILALAARLPSQPQDDQGRPVPPHGSGP